ncbi:MAG: group 1 truncated hemoglobin [Gammaproteobacteria bacterium]|nr:group 1 truncated hemoglobin [Gammaproteobacteria bacterium]MDP2346267.1 group 1 truncated hemoglobin [Gammaproteobacteria bacterium]
MGIRKEQNLFDALGGQEGVNVIVENFIMQIARDERIIDHFAVSNVERFRMMMREHLCFLADGLCEYTGDSMIDTHAGMGVTEGDFNAIVEDMMAAMNQAGVPIGTQNRLLSRLAKLRGEIIYL